MDSGGTEPCTEPCTEQCAGWSIEKCEIRQAVSSALDKLPSEHRTALEWKYADECTVAEIAKRLGKSCPATQSLIHRAKQMFRRAYQANAVPSTAEKGETHASS